MRLARLAVVPVTLVVPLLAPLTAPAVAAAPVTAKFGNVSLDCTEATMDGETYRQCLADFTTTVSGVRSGFRVILTARDPRYSTTRVVGRFKTKSRSWSRSFTDQVASYGSPDDPTRLRYRIKVKNRSGKVVLRTKARVFS